MVVWVGEGEDSTCICTCLVDRFLQESISDSLTRGLFYLINSFFPPFTPTKQISLIIGGDVFLVSLFSLPSKWTVFTFVSERWGLSFQNKTVSDSLKGKVNGISLQVFTHPKFLNVFRSLIRSHSRIPIFLDKLTCPMGL